MGKAGQPKQLVSHAARPCFAARRLKETLQQQHLACQRVGRVLALLQNERREECEAGAHWRLTSAHARCPCACRPQQPVPGSTSALSNPWALGNSRKKYVPQVGTRYSGVCALVRQRVTINTAHATQLSALAVAHTHPSPKAYVTRCRRSPGACAAPCTQPHKRAYDTIRYTTH